MKLISLLFRSKKSVFGVFVIIVLLVTQAYCELELPNYTSKIVDVGIMQGGIENAVPTQIRKNSLEDLKLFIPDEDISTVESAFSADSSSPDILFLNEEIKDDDSKIQELNNILRYPMLMLASQDAIATEESSESDSQEAMQPQSIDVDQVRAALAAGVMTKDDLLKMRDEAVETMEEMGLGDSMINTAAVAYVKAEYEAMNMDMEKIEISFMIRTGIMMAIFTGIAAVCSIVVCLIASFLAAAISKRLRKESFENILAFSNSEMDKFSAASLITRSTNDIQQVQMALVMFLRLVLFAPAMAIGGIFMISRTDTGLSWIVVVAIVVLAAIIGILLVTTMPKFKRLQPLIDNLNLVSREILTGLPVIRAFCREDYEKKRFDKANNELLKTQLFTNRAMSMFMPLIFFIMNIVMIGIVWFGGHGIDAGNMQVGDMLAFISYTMFIVMSFMMLSMVTIMLPRASVAADRVLEVVNTKISIMDKPKDELKDDTDFKGLVSFNDVSFRFDDADEDVLMNINFTAEPGQTTAIIGSTGCGKSTLINLIPRLFDVTKGSVTIDGVDVRDLSQMKLRSLIGFVPQKGMLFSGTIDTNLKFGSLDVTDEKMLEAAQIAQATDFINEKEDKYDSEISQGGTNVSGGQKQRLSIARAIARDPKIYIFDDSFSALDYKTDVNLRKALSKKTSDATVIIVAQRISTIRNAEKIIVLDDGEVVGIGTHKDLIEGCEVYREIAESQLSQDEMSA